MFEKSSVILVFRPTKGNLGFLHSFFFSQFFVVPVITANWFRIPFVVLQGNKYISVKLYIRSLLNLRCIKLIRYSSCGCMNLTKIEFFLNVYQFHLKNPVLLFSFYNIFIM